MKLQLRQLRDDLALAAPNANPDSVFGRFAELARRVADLYDECPVCAPPEPVSFKPSQCLRCHGLRVIPSGKWGDWRGNGPTIDPSALFRYLFGEDTRWSVDDVIAASRLNENVRGNI